MSLQLAMMFQDGCVLQQEKLCTIWGTADPGAEVVAELQGQRLETKADEQGKWQVTFTGLTAAKDEVLSVTETIAESAADTPAKAASASAAGIAVTGLGQCICRNVGIGEVWILGGQSNMEFQMRYDANLKEELKKETYPDIRFFAYPQVSYEGQLDDFDYSKCGKWRMASQENLEYFGAVGYYFANQIVQDANAPIGLLACNWGGTPACAWMDEEHVKKHGQVWLEDYEAGLKQLGLNREEFEDAENSADQSSRNRISEAGVADKKENLCSYDSAYRKYTETYRTSEYADRGKMFDDPAADIMMHPLTWEEQEKFLQMAQPMDPWIEKVCYIPGPYHQNRPSGLYHTMLEKVAPYTTRGVLWYQGESDAIHADVYADVFSDMVSNWRKLWHDSLPFFCVQLAPFDRWFQCTGEGFPEIRRAQQYAADHVEGVYLASIADVGNEFDIHPKQKQPVGERLALLAEKYVYGKTVEADAPRCNGAEILVDNNGTQAHVNGNGADMNEDDNRPQAGENAADIRIRILFSHAESGLTAHGDPGKEIKLYAVGEEQKEEKQQTDTNQQSERQKEEKQQIDRAAYEVSICSDSLEIIIHTPTAKQEKYRVAYCMTDYYEGNLYNRAGLPVFPFEFTLCPARS